MVHVLRIISYTCRNIDGGEEEQESGFSQQSRWVAVDGRRHSVIHYIHGQHKQEEKDDALLT